MRKLVLFMHTSLDGYVAAADKSLGWGAADTGVFEAAVPELTDGADTLLLGYVVANELLNYWLNAEAEEPDLSEGEIAYARWVTKAHKVVVSKTQKKLAWENTELQMANNDEDITRAISDLKQQPGKNIVVHGGVRTAQDLARLGLIDEYQLVVHPVVLGDGLSIFKTVERMSKLKLIGADELKNGVVLLKYKPANGGN